MALILVRPAGAFFAGAARAGLTLDLHRLLPTLAVAPAPRGTEAAPLRDAAGRSLGESWTRKVELADGAGTKS